MPKKVIVGMSGGVDSSVSALLLKQQGYDVTGVYMKNWSEDLPGMRCPWAEDLADAKRVAVRLGIPFEVWDFEQDYRTKVVDYMLAEFAAGRTPNPDVMCNQEIKFKLFYEKARDVGADYIATGHYAQVIRDGANTAMKGAAAGNTNVTLHDIAVADDIGANADASIGAPAQLGRAVDENKDQTYFLYRISEESLVHTIFPLGKMRKPEVKELAAKNGLPNAYKRESMGVCFVGEVGMREFLREYMTTRPGEIREAETDRVLGVHEGAELYTIGQRHGLYLSGVTGEANQGLPYYVVGKDVAQNIVYVSRNLNHEGLWASQLKLRDVIWRGGDAAINKATEKKIASEQISDEESDRPTDFHPQRVLVRLRHRGELIPATFDGQMIEFDQKVRRPAAGQSAVFYDETLCLGGGIIR